MDFLKRYCPEVYLEELHAGKITMEQAAVELERIAGFCDGVLSGEKMYGILPTQTTAEELYKTATHYAGILRAYLTPSLDGNAVKPKLAEVKDRLKEVRNEAIAGKCEKKNALALFDVICGEFKNEVTNIFRNVLKPSMGTLYNDDEFSRRISTTVDADAGIAGIRAQIEGMTEPAPDTQAPEHKAAADLTGMDTANSPHPSPVVLQGMDELILKGWITEDGRVLGDLNNVVLSLPENINVTKALVRTYFRKSDNTEYSDSTITQAVNLVNTH